MRDGTQSVCKKQRRLIRHTHTVRTINSTKLGQKRESNRNKHTHSTNNNTSSQFHTLQAATLPSASTVSQNAQTLLYIVESGRFGPTLQRVRSVRKWFSVRLGSGQDEEIDIIARGEGSHRAGRRKCGTIDTVRICRHFPARLSHAVQFVAHGILGRIVSQRVQVNPLYAPSSTPARSAAARRRGRCARARPLASAPLRCASLRHAPRGRERRGRAALRGRRCDEQLSHEFWEVASCVQGKMEIGQSIATDCVSAARWWAETPRCFNSRVRLSAGAQNFEGWQNALQKFLGKMCFSNNSVHSMNHFIHSTRMDESTFEKFIYSKASILLF